MTEACMPTLDTNGGNALSEYEAPTRQRDLGSGSQIGNPGVSTHEDVP